jgi:hypothetical protein
VAHRKVLPPKVCAWCKQPFERGRYGDRLEDLARYRARTTCSRTCAALHRHDTAPLRSHRSHRPATPGCRDGTWTLPGVPAELLAELSELHPEFKPMFERGSTAWNR